MRLWLLVLVLLCGCGSDWDPSFFCKGSRYRVGPVRDTTAYVVGGVVPSVGRSTVQYGGCSGVRMDSHTVLTVAHCMGEASVPVLVGTTSFEVAEVYVHPYWQSGSTRWDIAVLRTEEPMPGPFPAGIYDPAAGGYEPDARYSCNRLVLEGYGRGSEGGLHELEHVVGTAEWLVLGGESAFDPNTQAACKGDSGGPLYALMDDGTYWVAGLASWGENVSCYGRTWFVYLDLYEPWMREVRRCLAGGEDRPWDFYIGSRTGNTCEGLRK